MRMPISSPCVLFFICRRPTRRTRAPARAVPCPYGDSLGVCPSGMKCIADTPCWARGMPSRQVRPSRPQPRASCVREAAAQLMSRNVRLSLHRAAAHAVSHAGPDPATLPCGGAGTPHLLLRARLGLGGEQLRQVSGRERNPSVCARAPRPRPRLDC